MIYKLSLILLVSAVPIFAGTYGDYITLQTPCDPTVQNNGILTLENAGKVCFSGTQCNPETKICDCSDSDDGKWKRTYQDGQCRLLPGSKCLRVDQDYYRCVHNSVCTQTRKGVDNPRRCPADAHCDIGEFACKCEEGKSCLDRKVEAPKS